jgi:hypothetical protein
MGSSIFTFTSDGGRTVLDLAQVCLYCRDGKNIDITWHSNPSVSRFTFDSERYAIKIEHAFLKYWGLEANAQTKAAKKRMATREADAEGDRRGAEAGAACG